MYNTIFVASNPSLLVDLRISLPLCSLTIQKLCGKPVVFSGGACERHAIRLSPGSDACLHAYGWDTSGERLSGRQLPSMAEADVPSWLRQVRSPPICIQHHAHSHSMTDVLHSSVFLMAAVQRVRAKAFFKHCQAVCGVSYQSIRLVNIILQWGSPCWVPKAELLGTGIMVVLPYSMMRHAVMSNRHSILGNDGHRHHYHPAKYTDEGILDEH